ncbi:ATP-grasp protein [Syntrophobacter fumaroxidans]|uniref:ATP-grasp enzyme-like n=1 Tax=Syntrophobacter fumaroxidans (strain DSM 10017 / MPOB) TaxID=335543 RepID=A0LGV2_SYNFM|nr:ATP-grasp protein [Syntrophobacter fumaroxidans]ABK16654.1 ATP-grasp enzyme-like [Syntrophobacter fumaroxidans MPOB]
MPNTPAIVLSSHTIGLGVIRALGRMGVPVTVFYYREEDMGYLSKHVRRKVKVPNPATETADFVAALIDGAKPYSKPLLIPADDETLVAVSQHKAQLEEHFIVACEDWETVQSIIDKKYTYRLAEAHGVPSPKTFEVESLDELERYAEIMGFPLIIKPCHSHLYFEVFRKKMVKAHSLDEAVGAFKEADAHGLALMLQEHIPGDDSRGVNYNSYFWDGKPLVEFTAEKVRLAPPRFGVPRVLVSKYMPEVIDLGRKIVQAAGYRGYSCTEFKKDVRDGTYKLMEINGRHNLSSMLSVSCGINFPWLEYKHRVEGVLPGHCEFKTGAYWIDLTKDVLFSLKYLREERYSLAEYFRPYMKPHVFAIFDRGDLRPFVKRCFDFASNAAK